MKKQSDIKAIPTSKEVEKIFEEIKTLTQEIKENQIKLLEATKDTEKELTNKLNDINLSLMHLIK